ncbi:MAG: glycogen synthase [Gemmatimonadales bacterium]|nr:MAG: glycogen synthase [Gemmatimonadales bacterium]
MQDQAPDTAPRRTPQRFPGTVVHLVSEYWPYARTGGLAEAVRGIAHHQALAGFPTHVILPLYKRVRETFPDLEPSDAPPFDVPVGGQAYRARMWRHRVRDDEPVVHFVENDHFFNRDGLYGDDHGDFGDNPWRYAFYCRAALHWLPHISPGTTLVHAHDWHTSLAPVYARAVLRDDRYYRRVPFVLTVHNAGYQGYYGPELIRELDLPGWLYRPEYMEWQSRTNLLKGGLVFSDMVTTVSPTHAHELRTDMGGFGLDDTFRKLGDRLVGILNGIDYGVWNPSADPGVAAPFSRDDLTGKARNKAWLQEAAGLVQAPDAPLFGMTARLAQQKGFDILLDSGIVTEPGAQWVFLGEGEARYRNALQALADAYPDRVAAFFEFTEEREHRLLGGADFLLMPSLYEPCGLTQMRSQRYGALPIVRRVGGLADTVEDRVTGFVFDEYEGWALADAIRHAIDLYRDRDQWEEHVREAMSRDFSWEASVDRYQAVYARAMRRCEEQAER